jgi:hypothetical protein
MKISIISVILLFSGCSDYVKLKKSNGTKIMLSEKSVKTSDEIIFRSNDLIGGSKNYTLIDLKHRKAIDEKADYSFEFKISGDINNTKANFATFNEVSVKDGEKFHDILLFYIKDGILYGDLKYATKSKFNKTPAKVRILKSPNFPLDKWMKLRLDVFWSVKNGSISGEVNGSKINYQGPVGIKAKKTSKMKIGIVHVYGNGIYSISFRKLDY